MAQLSGQLSDNTIVQMDDDDMMQRIRNLMGQKEDLKNEIRMQAMEADAWLQVLGCTSSMELEDLASSLPSTVSLTTERQNLLLEHHKHSTELQAFTFLDGIAASETEEGNILIKFLQLPLKLNDSNLLILLNTGDDKYTYSVRYHNLPDVVPVTKLEEDYLKGRTGRDNANRRLQKFVTYIGQYTRALYSRQEQIFTLEKTEILTNTHVYRNTGCTFITFLVEVKEEIDKSASVFEFCLNYYPLDILPYKVKVKHIDGETPSSNILEIMDEMVLEMKKDPFPQVIYSVLRAYSSEAGTNHESTDSDSSADTVLF